MKGELTKPMAAEYAEYLRDESRCTGSAEAIAFPATEEELRELLADACHRGMGVTLQGARTGLAAAAVPNGGRIVNLMRMNRVLGIRRDEAGRFYLRVQPGLALSQLRKMIADRQFETAGWSEQSLEAYAHLVKAPAQMFPPDPTEATASLGGMTACNASGAISYRYGPMRRHVSGLRAVLCNGDTLTLRRGETRARGRHLELQTDSGARLSLSLPTFRMPATKNASGYYIEDDMDAVDLFVGSDGTLGALSEIELALTPKPPLIWGVSCFFRDEAKAVPFVQQVRQALQPAAVEYFDRNALAILRQQRASHAAFSRLSEIGGEYAHCVFLELHGAEEAAMQQDLFLVGSLMETLGAREADTWVARTEADRDRLQFFRHAIPESVNMMIDARRKRDAAITKLGTDMAVPDHCLAEILETYRTTLEEAGLEYAIWGHIGDNHLHVNILPNSGAEMEQGRALYSRWARLVSQMGGSVSAEHGVGKLKAPYLAVMYGERHIQEMAALKQAFDPMGLLGAGNLFAPARKGERP